MAAVREALLIACGHFDDTQLQRLRSPAEDLSALSEVLSDPDIGDFHVTALSDGKVEQWRRAIEKFFARRGLHDVLLCYVSSHGVKDEHGRLHFAARDTEKDWLASTGLPASYLRDLMERCRARTIILILDCCYSGAFVEGAKGDDSVPVKDELAGRGRVILTATNGTEYSWEGTRLLGEGTPSVFTAAVVDGLRSGAADRDGDGRVSVDDLSTYVYERLRDLGSPQTPMRWTSGVGENVYIAHAKGSGSSRRHSERDTRLLVEAIGRAAEDERHRLTVGLLAHANVSSDVVPLLTAPEESLRRGAAATLCEIGPDAVASLESFLTTAPDESFDGFCTAMSQVGPDAVPVLVGALDLLQGTDRCTRVTQALTGIGTVAALFQLIERGIEPPLSA